MGRDTSTGEALAPLIFIYDGKPTRALGILRLRLETYREHAGESCWELADEWVDMRHDALSGNHRPRFDDVTVAIRAAHTAGRTVVCLFNDWDRLTRDSHRQAMFRRTIHLKGGCTVTTRDENNRPHDGDTLRTVRPA